MNRRSTGRLLFTWALAVLTLMLFSPLVGTAMAQSDSLGGRSATPYDQAAVEQEVAVEEAQVTVFDAAAGGADVPLSPTNGPNEPAVAVNPMNPSNVIVAKLFGLRVSTDGGATFGAEISAVVPPTHGLCGDPVVAFDSLGRLFWTYLGCIGGGIDAFVVQVNPLTGAFIGGVVNATAAAGVGGNANDKQWLAVNRWPGSPFPDRIYLVWSNFSFSPVRLQTSFSTDQGATWSPAVTRSVPAEGFPWPSHNAVAPNGDVYVAYHAQPTFSGSNPNGTSGQIIVLRSTDGGVTYTKTTAFAAGNADITFNRPGAPARRLNQNVSWTQGSGQPWVLPDPLTPGSVYVVAADDPTDTSHGGVFDDMNVYIARSTNSGATWSAPARVDQGLGAHHAFFPTAAIDDLTACVVVNWYDTRNGGVNGAGNFLLDVFTTVSTDGGLTFSPDAQINDVAFNPELGAGDRFPPENVRRIGEYIGVAVANGVAHSVWTGNTMTGQQIVYENSPVPVACASNAPPVLTVPGPQSVDYHDLLTFGVSATDADAGDTLSFSATGLPAGLVLTDNLDRTATVSGIITVSPALSPFVATITVDDGVNPPVSDTVQITVTREQTTTTYTGPLVIANGLPVTLSGRLLEEGVTPIAGRALTLSVGTDSCIAAPTDVSGNASCVIPTVSVPLGPAVVTAKFLGDEFYLPSDDDSQTATVFAFPAGGAFVLGDLTAGAATPTTDVTFWSSKWSSLNALTGGPAPAAFKGFAAGLGPGPTTCGGGWTTRPGNSSRPPVGPLRDYMGVIVASSVSKSGNTISGNVRSIVVVTPNAGYDTNPGHSGTGRIVATFICP